MSESGLLLIILLIMEWCSIALFPLGVVASIVIIVIAATKKK
jgi:hypothetical protein